MRLYSLHACLSICLLVLFTVLAVASAPVAVTTQDLATIEQLDARTSKGTKRPAVAPAAAAPAPKKPKPAVAPAPAPAAGGSGSAPSGPSNSGPAPKAPAGAAPQGQPSAPQAGAAQGQPAQPQPPPQQPPPSNGGLANGTNPPAKPNTPTTASPFPQNGVNMPAGQHPKGGKPTTYTQADIDREAANAVGHYNAGTQQGKKGNQAVDPGRKFPHEMPNNPHAASNMPAPFPAPGSAKPQQADSGELKGQIMSWPIQPNPGPNPKPQSWNGNLKNLPADRLIMTKDQQDCKWQPVTCIRHDTNAPPNQGGFTQGTRYRRAMKAVRRAIASLGSSKSLSLGLA